MTLDRKCERCGQTYDPKRYWMNCPHSPLGDETAPLPVPPPDAVIPAGTLVLDYQRLAARTICNQQAAGGRIASLGSFDCPISDTIPVQVLHSLVGIQGEAGEIASIVQKWLWYGKEFSPGELTTKLADEYGDLLWYVMEGLSALGLDATKVMEANIAKLRARYPDRYTDVLAAEENRDRAAEEEEMKKVLKKTTVDEGVNWAEGKDRNVRIEQDGHGFGHVVAPKPSYPGNPRLDNGRLLCGCWGERCEGHDETLIGESS